MSLAMPLRGCVHARSEIARCRGRLGRFDVCAGDRRTTWQFGKSRAIVADAARASEQTAECRGNVGVVRRSRIEVARGEREDANDTDERSHQFLDDTDRAE